MAAKLTGVCGGGYARRASSGAAMRQSPMARCATVFGNGAVAQSEATGGEEEDGDRGESE